MGNPAPLDWNQIDWITPGIHLYAIVVFILVVAIFVIHRYRISELGRRLEALCRRIDGDHSTIVRLEETTSLMIHLGDLVERRSDLDLAPIVEFVKREEQQRGSQFVATLVNLTETMIELFPMLGIFGTVWGISGVGRAEFTSDRLLFLFGTATRTTLWALLYVIVFRILYSAFVQAKVAAYAEYRRQFSNFLSILDKRTNAVDFGMEGGSHPWREPVERA
jgi:hypothetical protein